MRVFECSLPIDRRTIFTLEEAVAACRARGCDEGFIDTLRGLYETEDAMDMGGYKWKRLPDVDEASPAQTRAERRERIATAVLAGLLANPEHTGPYSDFAEDAIACADALIAELDKTE